MPNFEINCEVCGKYSKAWREEKPHRFCSIECQKKGMVGQVVKPEKYKIDPKHYDRIKQTYAGTTGNGEIKTLASWLGIPRWKVTRFAISQGWLQKAVRSPPWTPEEDAALEKYARYCVEKIVMKMKKEGFTRTATAIRLRLKRTRMLKNLDGYSSRQLADCLGVDAKTVLRMIEQKKINAERRGTARTAQQHGDIWWIKPRNIRNFLIDYIAEIDMRKIDRFWLVDMLANHRELV